MVQVLYVVRFDLLTEEACVVVLAEPWRTSVAAIPEAAGGVVHLLIAVLTTTVISASKLGEFTLG